MTYPWNGFFWGQTDADGRFKIEGLLPEIKVGAQVMVIGRGVRAGGDLFEGLTLKPGEVRDVGEIKIKNLTE